MNQTLGVRSVTSVVRLLEMLPKAGVSPPAILVAAPVRLRSGGSRLVTERVPVPDAALFHQLTSDVAKGDELQITVETDWSDPDLPTRLTAYAAVGVLLAPTTTR